MKIYLHRKNNLNVVINGIQFTDGVAEINSDVVPTNLAKFYNVKDYPYGQKVKEEVKEVGLPEVNPLKVEEERKLNALANGKKEELKTKADEAWKKLPINELKQYVNSATGTMPRTKREAFKLMGEEV